MKQKNKHFSFSATLVMASLALLISLISLTTLSGCGGNGTDKTGSSPNGPDNGNLTSTAQDFGGLTTRIIGTAQSPVLSTGYGSAVIGVAGATFSDITQSYQTLNNTRIAFTSDRDGNNEIYVMNADGTAQTNITNNIAYDYLPSFSGDGTKIAFTSRRDGNDEIYTMNTDGSNQINRTNNASGDDYPTFSPDGTKIAFSSYRDSFNPEIYVMNADGTNVIRLTNNPASDLFPSFSSDGTKIAFTSFRDGNGEIYVMNADGSNQTRITNVAARDDSPTFSPDGTKIAFVSYRDSNYEIYVMNADGSSQTRLTNNPAFEDAPSFSPDGSKIAFGSTRDGSNAEIYTMNVNGTSQINRTNNLANGSYDYYPSWSAFRKPKYIGVSGLLGTECAGFLFGKQGKVNTSILTFDTPTLTSRTGARVTANTNTDTQSSNLAFTITTTTGLSNIKFINTTESVAVIAPTLPAGTTNALVLFDTYTGTVSDIVPYAANRSVSTRTVSGDLVTYTGKFTAIFDSTGKNLAPTGATSVTLDEKLGKLVKFE
jgi:Tol biopolymer transport system component